MKFTKRKIILFVFYIHFNFFFIDAARILAVFPTPSISHQIVFRPLVQEIVKRGHSVTVITPDPVYSKDQALANLTEIDVHDISYTLWNNNLLKDKKVSHGGIFNQVEAIMKVTLKIAEAQIASSDVQDIINKRKGQFDLLLLEAYPKPALIFSHIYKVPVIQISSLMGLSYNFEVAGAPTHPLLYPTLFAQRMYNLTMLEKIYNLYKHWRIENILDECEENDNKNLKRLFGPNTPSIRELSNNVHMIFLYGHPIWTNNKPVPPSVIYIGRLNKNPHKELPRDLKFFLNSSKHGVIYFSLGTNVIPSLLPPSKIQMMIKVFSELPYDVIWKWDKDTLPGRTEKIKICKWLPQSDILRHPNIKLFITQGGLQSTEEAIEAEVPLLGIPLLGDQWYNTEQYEHLKIGIRLDLPSLTEKEFKESIENIIFDKSYRENIKKLRSIVEDEPQSALERAVWWTEYVLRHGGAKHLRAAGANLTWTEYLELELIAVVCCFLFAAIAVACIAVTLIWRYIYKNITLDHKVKIT